ncbi:MAG: glycosyltransferase [Campylobacter sp.]|nr:glycosyltransferase [Campylobacter sp.]
MKILFVISTLRNGGAEKVMAVLSSYFANFHDVSLVKFESLEPFYEISEKVKIINLDYGVDNKGFFANLKKRFGKIFAIRNLIKNGKFDCVISFMDSTNLLSIIAKFGLKTPLIISEHSNHTLLSKKWQILKRLFYPFANGLTVLTDNDFNHYSYAKNRTKIYNPMFADAQNFSQTQKENLIIFVGRLIKIKGCDIFLNALKLVDLNGWKAEILGDGDEMQNLQNLAKNLNLNAEFKGSVKNVDEYYKRAKIVVLSSLNEAFGNVLVESINFNCIRVATPTVGAKELIKDGFDGFISDDFRAENLAKKIKIAMQSNNEITQNANSRKDEFKIEKIYEKWLEFINSTLEKNNL